VVDATISNSDVLPIIYYRPFKAANFYLRGRFAGKESLANMDDF
jgi:hypothetical protein